LDAVIVRATGDLTGGKDAERYGFDCRGSFERWRLRTHQEVDQLAQADDEFGGGAVREAQVARWVDLGLLPINYKYERGDVRPGEMIFRFYRCWRKWVENKSMSPTENEKHWCTELCPGFLALKAVKIEDEAESELYGYSLWEPIDSDWDDTDDGGEFAEGSDDDDDDESCN
jgi:hypothetical protein